MADTVYKYDNNRTEEVFDYDSEIAQDDFEILPEGEYEFTVVNAERDRFSGSEKAAPCPIVKLTIRAESRDGGSADVRHSFFLYKRNEWQLSQFFTCIGLKRRGEPLRMNWQAAIGRKGRCSIGKRQYNGKDYNEVKKFLPPAGGAAPAYGEGGF